MELAQRGLNEESGSPTEIELRVPEGATSGDTLLVDTGTLEMEIEIPAGLGAGDAFTVVLADVSSEEEQAQQLSQQTHPDSSPATAQAEPGTEGDGRLGPDARAAAWSLNSTLRQARQYIQQQQRMREQLTVALPHDAHPAVKAVTTTDALLAWLRSFPSVVTPWYAWPQTA